VAREQAADQGHHDRQRKVAAGEGDASRDRCGHRRAGRHIGDALKHHFAQANGLAAKLVGTGSAHA
jgi:hypothetical protein